MALRPVYVHASSSGAELHVESGNVKESVEPRESRLDIGSQNAPPDSGRRPLLKQAGANHHWDVPTILSSWHMNSACHQDVRSLLHRLVKSDTPIFIDTATCSAQENNQIVDSSLFLVPTLSSAETVQAEASATTPSLFQQSSERLVAPGQLGPLFTDYSLRRSSSSCTSSSSTAKQANSPLHKEETESPTESKTAEAKAERDVLSEKPTVTPAEEVASVSDTDSRKLSPGADQVEGDLTNPSGKGAGELGGTGASDSIGISISDSPRPGAVDPGGRGAIDLEATAVKNSREGDSAGSATCQDSASAFVGTEASNYTVTLNQTPSEQPPRQGAEAEYSGKETAGTADSAKDTAAKDLVLSAGSSSDPHTVLDPLSLKKRYSQLLAPVPNYTRSAELATVLRRVPRIRVRSSVQRFGPQRRSKRVLAVKAVRSAAKKGRPTEVAGFSSKENSCVHVSSGAERQHKHPKKSPRLALKRQHLANTKASTLASVKKAAIFEKSEPCSVLKKQAVGVREGRPLALAKATKRTARKTGVQASRALLWPRVASGNVLECSVVLQKLSQQVLQQWMSSSHKGRMDPAPASGACQEAIDEHVKLQTGSVNAAETHSGAKSSKEATMPRVLASASSASSRGSNQLAEKPTLSGIAASGSNVSLPSRADDRTLPPQKKLGCVFKKSSIFLNRFMKEHPGAIGQQPVQDGGKPGAFFKGSRTKKSSPLGRASFTRKKGPWRSLDAVRSPVREIGSPGKAAGLLGSRALPGGFTSPPRDVRQSPLAYIDNYSELFPVEEQEAEKKKHSSSQSHSPASFSCGPLSPGSTVNASEAASAIIQNLQKIVGKKSPLYHADKSPEETAKDGDEASPTSSSRQADSDVRSNTKEVSYTDWLAEVKAPSSAKKSQCPNEAESSMPLPPRPEAAQQSRRQRRKAGEKTSPLMKVKVDRAGKGATDLDMNGPKHRAKRGRKSRALPSLPTDSVVVAVDSRDIDPELPELSKMGSKGQEDTAHDGAEGSTPPLLDLAPVLRRELTDLPSRRKKRRSRKESAKEEMGSQLSTANLPDGPEPPSLAQLDASTSHLLGEHPEGPQTKATDGTPMQEHLQPPGETSSGSISSDSSDSPCKDGSCGRKRKSAGHPSRLYGLRRYEDFSILDDDEEALEKALQQSLLDVEGLGKDVEASNMREILDPSGSRILNADLGSSSWENSNTHSTSSDELMKQFAIKPSVVSIPWLTNSDIEKIQKDAEPADTAAKKAKGERQHSETADCVAGDVANGQLDHVSRRKSKPRKCSRGIPHHEEPSDSSAVCGSVTIQGGGGQEALEASANQGTCNGSSGKDQSSADDYLTPLVGAQEVVSAAAADKETGTLAMLNSKAEAGSAGTDVAKSKDKPATSLSRYFPRENRVARKDVPKTTPRALEGPAGLEDFNLTGATQELKLPADMSASSVTSLSKATGKPRPERVGRKDMGSKKSLESAGPKVLPDGSVQDSLKLEESMLSNTETDKRRPSDEIADLAWSAFPRVARKDMGNNRPESLPPAAEKCERDSHKVFNLQGSSDSKPSAQPSPSKPKHPRVASKGAPLSKTKSGGGGSLASKSMKKETAAASDGTNMLELNKLEPNQASPPSKVARVARKDKASVSKTITTVVDCYLGAAKELSKDQVPSKSSPAPSSLQKPARFGRVPRKDMPIKGKKAISKVSLPLSSESSPQPDSMPEEFVSGERRRLPGRRSKSIAEERLKSQNEDRCDNEVGGDSIPAALNLKPTVPTLSVQTESLAHMPPNEEHATAPISEPAVLAPGPEKRSPKSPGQEPSLLLSNSDGPAPPLEGAVSGKSYVRSSSLLKGSRMTSSPNLTLTSSHTNMDVFDFEQNEEAENSASSEHVKLNRPILMSLMSGSTPPAGLPGRYLNKSPLYSSLASPGLSPADNQMPPAQTRKGAGPASGKTGRKRRFLSTPETKPNHGEADHSETTTHPKPSFVYKPVYWPENEAIDTTEVLHPPGRGRGRGRGRGLSAACKGIRGRGRGASSGRGRGAFSSRGRGAASGRSMHQRTKSESAFFEPKDTHTIEDYLRIMAPKTNLRQNTWSATEDPSSSDEELESSEPELEEPEVSVAPNPSGRAQRRSKLLAQKKIHKTHKVEEEADLPTFPSEWKIQPRFALPPNMKYSPPHFDPDSLPDTMPNSEDEEEECAVTCPMPELHDKGGVSALQALPPSQDLSSAKSFIPSATTSAPVKLKLNLVKSDNGGWKSKRGVSRGKNLDQVPRTEPDPYDAAHSGPDESSDDEGPYGFSDSEPERPTSPAGPEPARNTLHSSEELHGRAHQRHLSTDSSVQSVISPTAVLSSPASSRKCLSVGSPGSLTVMSPRPDLHSPGQRQVQVSPYNPHATNISSPEPTPGRRTPRYSEDSCYGLTSPQYSGLVSPRSAQPRRRQSSTYSDAGVKSPTEFHWPVDSASHGQIQGPGSGPQNRKQQAGKVHEQQLPESWNRHKPDQEATHAPTQLQARSPPSYLGVYDKDESTGRHSQHAGLVSPTGVRGWLHAQRDSQVSPAIASTLDKAGASQSRRKKAKRSPGSTQHNLQLKQPQSQTTSKASLADQIYEFPSDSPETFTAGSRGQRAGLRRPSVSSPRRMVTMPATEPHATPQFSKERKRKTNASDIHGSTTMTPETDSSDVFEPSTRKHRHSKRDSDSSDLPVLDHMTHKSAAYEQSPFSDINQVDYNSSKHSLDLSGGDQRLTAQDFDTPPSLSSFADTPLSSEAPYPPQLQPSLGMSQPPTLSSQKTTGLEAKAMLQTVNRMMAGMPEPDLQRLTVDSISSDASSPGPPHLEPVTNICDNTQQQPPQQQHPQNLINDKDDIMSDMFPLDENFSDFFASTDLGSFGSLPSTNRFMAPDRRSQLDSSQTLTPFNIEEILQSAERDLVPSTQPVVQLTSHHTSSSTFNLPAGTGRDDGFLNSSDIMETINPNLIYTKDADGAFGGSAALGNARNSGLPNFSSTFLQPPSVGTPGGTGSSGLLEDSDESDNGMDRLLSQPSVRFRGSDEKGLSPGAEPASSSAATLGSDLQGIMDPLWENLHVPQKEGIPVAIPKQAVPQSKQPGVMQQVKSVSMKQSALKDAIPTGVGHMGGMVVPQHPNFEINNIVSANMGIITCNCGAVFQNSLDYQSHESFCNGGRF